MKNTPLIIITALFFLFAEHGYAEDSVVSCPEHSFVCDISNSVTSHARRVRDAYRIQGGKKPNNSVILMNGQPLPEKYYKTKGNKLIIENIDLHTKPSLWRGVGNSEGGLVIEAGKNVKHIVLHNINIHSRSGRNLSMRNQAPLVLNAGDARKVDMYNINIEARGLHLTNIDNTQNECVGMMCVYAPEASVRLDDFSSSLSGENYFTIK